MENLEITSGSDVRLLVSVSSDAIAGSNVTLNDAVIKKSTQYSFSVDLGKIDDLHNKIVSIVSNFLVTAGNIDPIFNATQIKYTFKFGEDSKEYTCEKVKINNALFMGYFMVKLVKI